MEIYKILLIYSILFVQITSAVPKSKRKPLKHSAIFSPLKFNNLPKKAVVFKALSYIYEDSEADRIKKAKVLGRNLSVAYPADVLDFLIETAEKEPKKIIDLYEGEDWKMHLFLLDAIERNVISKKDGIYRYDDKMLGGSIEACITFLKDIRFNKLLSSIKMETYPELRPDEDITKIQQESLSGLNIKTGKNK